MPGKEGTKTAVWESTSFSVVSLFSLEDLFQNQGFFLIGRMFKNRRRKEEKETRLNFVQTSPLIVQTSSTRWFKKLKVSPFSFFLLLFLIILKQNHLSSHGRVVEEKQEEYIREGGHGQQQHMVVLHLSLFCFFPLTMMSQKSLSQAAVCRVCTSMSNASDGAFSFPLVGPLTHTLSQQTCIAILHGLDLTRFLFFFLPPVIFFLPLLLVLVSMDYVQRMLRGFRGFVRFNR